MVRAALGSLVRHGPLTTRSVACSTIGSPVCFKVGLLGGLERAPPQILLPGFFDSPGDHNRIKPEIAEQ